MTEASKRKRRKLIQVLGLYAASAWAGIEFLLLVIDRTGLPPVWEGSVIALFLAGFPVAAWLTWVFADPETRPAPSSFRGLAHLAGSAALLVAVTAIVAVSVEDLMSGAKTASIAVLPCDDRGLAGQAHRANEIPEDVRSRLSQIPALRVTAWQSSKYVASMGMGVDETRETLGTGWVVQCAMRLEGDRLALEASLLKGSTDGESVWSRSFDFRVEDTMDVVERLTAEVVKRLGIQTEASRLQRILARPTFSAEAYDHYMRARQLWLTRTAENVAASVDLFFAALEIDPDFAHAWAGLGDAAWILKYHASESIIEEVRDRNPEFEIDPQAYALRAIELNDAVAEAWSVRWRSQVERGHWHAPEDARERARRWHEKVLMLDPNYALEYMWWVEDMDPPARATEDKIGLLRRGLVLDPASLLIREVLITYLRPREGSLPEILDIARTMLSLDPEFHRLPGLLASIEVER